MKSIQLTIVKCVMPLTLSWLRRNCNVKIMTKRKNWKAYFLRIWIQFRTCQRRKCTKGHYMKSQTCIVNRIYNSKSLFKGLVTIIIKERQYGTLRKRENFVCLKALHRKCFHNAASDQVQ